jgi:DNA (cytosine-5)-methyltransferase 1
MEKSKIILIDLFCGAGGVTTGFEAAKLNKKKIAKVVACVNHDAGAIDSHKANHPHVKHYREDIRTLGLGGLIKMVANLRAKFPEYVIVLWASLECTNFSKAKGGLPRDADSRTLAEHLYRYLESLHPDYLIIENVAEFMSWGPLDENGKPINKKNGRDYEAWKTHIKSYGYDFDHRMLNAANYGAYTSRERFFGIFAKQGFPIAWPQATHAKNPHKADLFSPGLKKWKAVKDVLDLNDHGYSIFNRDGNLDIPKRNRKPLVEKTLARIHAGLIKHVAGGKDAFLAKTYAVASNHHGTTGINNPTTTITTRDSHSLVSPEFLINYHGKDDDSNNLEGPNRTLTVKPRSAFVNVHFISKYFSGRPESKNISVDGPAGTIRTSDGQALITGQFLDKNYNGEANHQSIEYPAGTILQKDHFSLVTPFVLSQNFDNNGSSVENPLPVITANRKWHYLMNPQYMNAGGSIDNPSFTLIARMDKMPPYLVTTEEGYLAIEIFETDSEYTRKIKEFMAMYGIVDIKMRMLKIKELLKIQGFPEQYILMGSQADQKKFIGNSVEVTQATVICEALAQALFTPLPPQVNKVAA